MKKLLFALFSICLAFNTNAQMNGVFGNEWIDYSQKYYKIKIAKEGIYTINYNDLTLAGLTSSDIAAIKPDNIQLFYRGLEIPIYVSAQGKSTFSNGDWIEFYGKKNDGKLDQPLYTKPEWQPQNYQAFFNDTSVYFLTWTVTAP
ncbi:MAG: hypothetical protein HYZ42_05085, partial [Bacteroidetes bacterium]|nr:hypothetical protein [Bacteroidota bacterium]